MIFHHRTINRPKSVTATNMNNASTNTDCRGLKDKKKRQPRTITMTYDTTKYASSVIRCRLYSACVGSSPLLLLKSEHTIYIYAPLYHRLLYRQHVLHYYCYYGCIVQTNIRMADDRKTTEPPRLKRRPGYTMEGETQNKNYITIAAPGRRQHIGRARGQRKKSFFMCTITGGVKLGCNYNYYPR